MQMDLISQIQNKCRKQNGTGIGGGKNCKYEPTITHLQVPETMVPSLGRQKCCSKRVGFRDVFCDGTITNLGATIKAASVSQLESLAGKPFGDDGCI